MICSYVNLHPDERQSWLVEAYPYTESDGRRVVSVSIGLPKAEDGSRTDVRIYGTAVATLHFLDDLKRAVVTALRQASGGTVPLVITGDGPCVACGHDPACGYASVWTNDGGEAWYCHDEDHSCYVTSGRPSYDFTPRPLGIGLLFNEDCDCCVYRHVHDDGFISSFHPELTDDNGGGRDV